MKDLIQKLNKWLNTNRPTASSEVGELEKKSGEITPVELPQPIKNKLVKNIQRLPPHFSRVQLVQSGLAKAIQAWQDDHNAPNCLVVLSSPVEPIADIISTCLEDDIEPLKSVIVLPHTHRPERYDEIWADFKSKLDQIKLDQPELGSCLSSARSPLPLDNKAKIQLNNSNTNTINANTFESELSELQLNKLDITTDFGSLFVIPCLDWCFLRCVDGLDNIDELQSAVLRDRSHFWLIGCSDWAWQYLEQVCQVSSFLEQTLTIPALTGLELKQWLAPVSDTLNLESYWRSADAKTTTDVEESWTSKAEQSYFETLAAISTGIPHIAAQIWLRSLRGSQSEQATISVVTPELPALPKLTIDDRYLLFSLALHRTISLSHLAISLGEDEQIVQRQVQVLQRAGIIEQRHSGLQLNPAYYIRLKSDFKRNNFLVKEGEA